MRLVEQTRLRTYLKRIAQQQKNRSTTHIAQPKQTEQHTPQAHCARTHTRQATEKATSPVASATSPAPAATAIAAVAAATTAAGNSSASSSTSSRRVDRMKLVVSSTALCTTKRRGQCLQCQHLPCNNEHYHINNEERLTAKSNS